MLDKIFDQNLRMQLRGDVPLSNSEIALELTRIYIESKIDIIYPHNISGAYLEFKKAVDQAADESKS